MPRVKTSIYIDKELWSRFKAHASSRGLEASKFLENLIKEVFISDAIDEALKGMNISEDYEINFEPVVSREPVSELVRVVRDERRNHLSGQ